MCINCKVAGLVTPEERYFTISTKVERIYREFYGVILVISCPCALVISIPLGYFGGIGGASRKGILIKGSNYIDILSKLQTVVFDKTGTLTTGSFEVTGVFPENGFSKEELLARAAAAEAHSNHPVALSIKKAYGKDIDEGSVASHTDIPGAGINQYPAAVRFLRETNG